MSDLKIEFSPEISNYEEENIFDFIKWKLNCSTCDTTHYFTDIGDCVIWGFPYKDSWEEYTIYYYGSDYLDKCSPELKKQEAAEWEKDKRNYMKGNNLTEEGISFLNMLHQQYLAISAISHGENIEENERIIADTYEKTGINCLEFLCSLFQEKKIFSEDYHGNQLAAVLTGHTANPIIILTEPAKLKEYNKDFVTFRDKINEICAEKKATSGRQV